MAAKLIVVEQVYHQNDGDEPAAYESRWCRILLTDEQPYGPRKVKVDREWRLLDTGWLNDASLLGLSNEEGKHLQANPTAAEADLSSRKVVELSFDGSEAAILIHPGQDCRFSPANVNGIWLRCQAGPVNIMARVYPK